MPSESIETLSSARSPQGVSSYHAWSAQGLLTSLNKIRDNEAIVRLSLEDSDATSHRVRNVEGVIMSSCDPVTSVQFGDGKLTPLLHVAIAYGSGLVTKDIQVTCLEGSKMRLLDLCEFINTTYKPNFCPMVVGKIETLSV